jgi:hypothetical protein
VLAVIVGPGPFWKKAWASTTLGIGDVFSHFIFSNSILILTQNFMKKVQNKAK